MVIYIYIYYILAKLTICFCIYLFLLSSDSELLYLLFYSFSDDDAEDTTDSLDIKPPQANIHSSKPRSHREKHSYREREKRAYANVSTRKPCLLMSTVYILPLLWSLMSQSITHSLH